ncbi:MAG: hypothetical protein SFV54_05125 [Bryobacteraceae bacterium]|nr:hypothetical protein [Bryobacteraceae bacterium]
MRFLVVWALLGLATLVRADLASVKAEPRPEKRSEKAMLNADAALTAARQAWKDGKTEAFRASLDEVRQSVELALQTLKDTGKHPSKMTRYYKNGEQRASDLDRRLKSFSSEAGLEDRPVIDELQKYVQAVHEEFLLGVMSKKR